MINNNINLIVGYGLAITLYVGYTARLLLKRRNLQAAVATYTDTDSQDR
jgi:hypothetical protein